MMAERYDGPCMCEWPDDCAGTGFIECNTCGGDQCVCVCGGECIDCPGCPECPDQHGDEA